MPQPPGGGGEGGEEGQRARRAGRAEASLFSPQPEAEVAGQNRGRSRDGPAPEVEGDDDDYGIHEDGRYGPPLEENVPVRRGHDNRNRPAHAPMRESEGLGKLADRRDRHIRATVDGALKPDDSRLKKVEESRR